MKWLRRSTRIGGQENAEGKEPPESGEWIADDGFVRQADRSKAAIGGWYTVNGYDACGQMWRVLQSSVIMESG